MPSNLRDVMRGCGAVLLIQMVLVATAFGQARERIRIAVGHSEVVQSSEDVRTVAIAEPTIADAAVGSARSVVINAKSSGWSRLVVYSEGGRYKVYDIEVYVPNGEKQVLLHVNVSELDQNATRELGLD